MVQWLLLGGWLLVLGLASHLCKLPLFLTEIGSDYTCLLSTSCRKLHVLHLQLLLLLAWTPIAEAGSLVPIPGRWISELHWSCDKMTFHFNPQAEVFIPTPPRDEGCGLAMETAGAAFLSMMEHMPTVAAKRHGPVPPIGSGHGHFTHRVVQKRSF